MIYMIRHGQTELNSRHALQGRSDLPLNANGIREAKETAALLSSVCFGRVFSSPLSRAVQTAQIIAPKIPVQIDERLIEMDYGPYEGMDLENPAPEVLRFFRDFVHIPAPDGMEQLQRIIERTGNFLEECCRSEEDILISTHAIAMKGILEYLTPESGGEYWSKHIGNCEIYITEFRDGAFTIPVPYPG